MPADLAVPAESVVHFVRRPARRSALARLGDAMVRHRKVIVALQWAVIVAYAVLVALPAFLPLPPAGANMLNNLTLAAQFAFWGL